MTDPLSFGVSILAIVTAAVKSTKTLCETVKRYKGRDKTLGRLQDELEEMASILVSLSEVTSGEDSMCTLLRDPVDRCSRLCLDFERSMKQFIDRPKASLLDWAKLEFKRGDINEFIDTLSGYKATISVGLGIMKIKSSNISSELLEEYNELIQTTSYNLQVHLQRIDEKLSLLEEKKVSATVIDADLNDEKEVTLQCLLICQDAKSYLESLDIRQAALSREESASSDSVPASEAFAALRLTRQTLEANRDKFAETIGRLRERLESVVQGSPDGDVARKQLREDLDISNQCLQVCKSAADQVSQLKIHTIGEVIADGDSDQVVVTTLADLFDVRKATSRGKSAQLIGSMNDETLQQMSRDRYSSRFGTHHQKVEIQEDNPTAQRMAEKAKKPPEAKTAKPTSNEVRRRKLEEKHLQTIS